MVCHPSVRERFDDLRWLYGGPLGHTPSNSSGAHHVVEVVVEEGASKLRMGYYANVRRQSMLKAVEPPLVPIPSAERRAVRQPVVVEIAVMTEEQQ